MMEELKNAEQIKIVSCQINCNYNELKFRTPASSGVQM